MPRWLPQSPGPVRGMPTPDQSMLLRQGRLDSLEIPVILPGDIP
jgi:hypothetical protein